MKNLYFITSARTPIAALVLSKPLRKRDIPSTAGRGTTLAGVFAGRNRDIQVANAAAAMKNSNRVLVVSDKDESRRGYLRSLVGVFPNVEFVSDESGAMDAMERQPFDVVLLDLRTSGGDGLSALRVIKQKWPQSEVVIITGAPTVANAKEAVRLGAYDYVAKPVSPQEIVSLATLALTQKAWTIHRTSELAGVDCGSAYCIAARGSASNGRAKISRGEKS